MMLMNPLFTMDVLEDSDSGKEIGSPWLKVCESTSVRIIPIPMESTIVALMSTDPRFCITFWNSGAERRFRPTEDSTPARIPSARLFPVACSTTHVMYIENTTTCG